MITLSALVSLIVYLLVAGIVLWLLYWLVGVVNPPEPFKKVATVVLAIVAVLVVISILLGAIGHPVVVLR